MKNKTKNTSFVLPLLVLMFLLFSFNGKSQNPCPVYTITNNTSCTVKVAWQRWCNASAGTSAPVMCSNGSRPITAGATVTIAVAACNLNGASCTQCDFVVNLVAINAMAYNGQPVNSSTPFVTWPAGMCPGSAGNMTWAAGWVNIN